MLKSLEGADRNVCASRAWKGGKMKLAFLQSTVLRYGAFLFSRIALFELLRHIDFTALPSEGGI